MGGGSPGERAAAEEDAAVKHGTRAMALHCAGCTDAPADAREEAQAVLGPKVSKMKPKSKRGARVEKAAKRETKRERTSGYYDKVRARSGGTCELGDWLPAVEQHHIIYGSGLRKALESEKTLIDLCREHHDEAHASDLETLAAIKRWARRSGFRLAEAACEHRINKKLRVRATTPSLAHRSKRSA